jgi:transposase InsO family protein
VGKSRRGGQKKVDPTSSRTAEQPEQTINVDLCFVPANHEVREKIPAVSGSSGRLVVERPKEEKEREWPGRVFEDEELSYEEAMLKFVAASQAKEGGPEQQDKAEKKGLSEPISTKEARHLLKKEEKQWQNERRQVREQRKLEDLAWQEARTKRKEQQEAYRSLRKMERREQRQVKQVQDEQWCLIRQQRRDTLEKRGQEDVEWRQKRNSLRERLSGLPVVTCWIAILVIVDNCTRQCLGLPLFVAGPKVTAEMVVEALRVLLPPELQFLISDRGTHFKADDFKMLMLSEEFIHVFIARHRPQSNGIAERFVRTLKEWLADKSWPDDQELAALLRLFLDEYNNQPHQGLPIPGLSPNEFANRIWLM